MRLGARATLLGALVALAAACGGDGGSGADAPMTPVEPVEGAISVRAFEWGFDPSAIVLDAGEEVTLELVNDGQVLHNWKVDDLPAEVLESESSGPLQGREGDAFVGAEAGQGGLLRFVPREPGEYTYYCTIEGHRALGMEGPLTVR